MSGRRIYLNIRHKISQLLNPALCLSCAIPIPSSDYLCSQCLQALAGVSNACNYCGLPNPASPPICPACRQNPPRWQRMIAPLVYQDMARRLIQRYKFDQQLHIAQALLSHFYSLYNSPTVEVLIPVPLHKTRLLERGFNQSEEIAQALSRLLNIPLDRHSLQRTRPTLPQSGLSLHKRQKNLRQAFRYQPGRSYQAVAIVDDVITTGSTMSEICKLLQRHGVKHVEVWSLCRALRHE
ncbi:MAG: amidophosphoribosyltransferase [Gammaproteobacteria bacterium]|jgi:ComF family protein|nr:amidophosphoribosyltransferase [Gammaproteobacteria bacterium]MBL6999670.1 amidophosphoribosyltransferase [Gammaproteobacteria bacterium]